MPDSLVLLDSSSPCLVLHGTRREHGLADLRGPCSLVWKLMAFPDPGPGSSPWGLVFLGKGQQFKPIWPWDLGVAVETRREEETSSLKGTRG